MLVHCKNLFLSTRTTQYTRFAHLRYFTTKMAEEEKKEMAPQPYASKFMVDAELKREYFSVAPMVDVSDKHFRYFMRLLTKHAWLYTEMVNENAVLHAC